MVVVVAGQCLWSRWSPVRHETRSHGEKGSSAKSWRSESAWPPSGNGRQGGGFKSRSDVLGHRSRGRWRREIGIRLVLDDTGNAVPCSLETARELLSSDTQIFRCARSTRVAQLEAH